MRRSKRFQAKGMPIRVRKLSGVLRVAGFVAGLAALAGVSPGSASSARATGMAFLPHQASYDLSLLKSRGGAAGVSSARGRILYNFSGSACEGYTSTLRQVSELAGGEGKSTLSDMRSTNWEDAEGNTFRFRIETRMNERNATDVDGIAERSGDRITVKLKQPAAKTFTLDGGIVFPTEQVHRIIAAAREGKSLLELAVYDGSDTGEKVYNTLTVIGKPVAGAGATASDPSMSNDATKAVTRWPVTVSYYDRDAKSNSGEQTPTYAMSFELFENGVSRALKIDYNDFVIAGALDTFEAKPSKPCKPGEK